MHVATNGSEEARQALLDRINKRIPEYLTWDNFHELASSLSVAQRKLITENNRVLYQWQKGDAIPLDPGTSDRSTWNFARLSGATNLGQARLAATIILTSVRGFRKWANHEAHLLSLGLGEGTDNEKKMAEAQLIGRMERFCSGRSSLSQVTPYGVFTQTNPSIQD